MFNLASKNKPRLWLELNIYGDRHVYPDFDRFNYEFVPRLADKHLAKRLDREHQVFKWYSTFKVNNEYAETTLHSLYRGLCEYVRACDHARVDPESKNGVECWEKYLVHRVRTNQESANSARGKLSQIKTLLKLFEQPVDEWFSRYKLFRSELNPTHGYSDKELKQLLRILKTLYYQLSEQIRKAPRLHLEAPRRKATAHFSYQDKSVEVHAAITKCFCAAYFLMAYYTWGNASSLRDMKIPSVADTERGKWFSQNILKRRANKYVSIELGDSFSSTVPKHGLKFIEDLISLVTLLFPDEERLFHQCTLGKRQALCPGHILATVNWLTENFELTSDNGTILRPEAKRFRATGSTNYLMKTGNALETSIVLGNTPETVSRHYSSGNKSDNNAQIQATALTLENAVRCSDISTAKRETLTQMNLEILPYDEFVSKYVINNQTGEKTAIGTGCKNPYDSHKATFINKTDSPPDDVSHLACADILNCFGCANQVIVEEVDDIWCLLSFRESLIEDREDHISPAQFDRNFSLTLKSLDEAILKINPRVRRFAEKKLCSEGRHPIWPEHLNLIF